MGVEFKAMEVVLRKPPTERFRIGIAGVSLVAAVFGALILVSTSARGSENSGLLSTNSWAWGDQPLPGIDPASAAVQAASLARVAHEGFLAESHKLAKLRMLKVAQLSGAFKSQGTLDASEDTASTQPFSDEVAQRLKAVDGASKDAQIAASAALSHNPLPGVQGSSKLWSPITGSHLASPDLALPPRTTRNGLALDYFHLTNLPAATAVRFAKREVAVAMVKPAAPPPGLQSVDAMAKAAFEKGTETVVSRREKAGILPMPINQGWHYSIKKAKEQVGEKVTEAQMAVAKINAKSTVSQNASASVATVLQPVANTTVTDTEAASEGSEKGTGSPDVDDQLEKLEAEVKRLQRLQQEKSMVDKLNALKAKEAHLESKYPGLNTLAQKGAVLWKSA